MCISATVLLMYQHLIRPSRAVVWRYDCYITQPQSHTPCTLFIIIHLTPTKLAHICVLLDNTHICSYQDLSLIQRRLFWRSPQHDSHVAFQWPADIGKGIGIGQFTPVNICISNISKNAHIGRLLLASIYCHKYADDTALHFPHWFSWLLPRPSRAMHSWATTLILGKWTQINLKWLCLAPGKDYDSLTYQPV